jgi:hypothetical protein
LADPRSVASARDSPNGHAGSASVADQIFSQINPRLKLSCTFARELIHRRRVYRATGFDAFNLTTLSPMKVTDIAFTGYPVTNMKRAKKFYEGFLGLKKSRGFGQKDGEEQWVEYDVGSSCLALISSAPTNGLPPNPALQPSPSKWTTSMPIATPRRKRT